jgi:hypothetical protein
VDEIESELWHSLVKRVGQFPPHLPQQPVKSSPNGESIS